MIQRCQREQQAKRQNRPRRGIADQGQRQNPMQRAAAGLAQRIDQDQGRRHSRKRRPRPDDQRIGQRRAKPWGKPALGGLGRMVKHHADRKQKAPGKGQKTGQRSDPAPDALRLLPRDRPAVPGRAMEPRPAPTDPFQPDQQKDQHQDDSRDLRGAPGIAVIQPGRKDPGRQRLHPKMIDSAIVRHRLHQDQRQPCRNRRARQRQADPPEHRPWPCPQGTRHLIGPAGLFTIGRPRHQIDVRIQRQRQNQDCRPQRPGFRKPVVAGRLPAEGRAQARLHRAGIIQQINQRIGPYIGRDRQRKEQRIDQPIATGKVVKRDKPGGPDPHRSGKDRNAQHQGHRGHQIAGQHRRPKMRPDILDRVERNPDNRNDGRQHQYRQNHGGQDPKIGTAARRRLGKLTETLGHCG